jgi:hypothetical protein
VEGKLFRSGFRIFREGLNILEILELSLLDSPTLDLSLIEHSQVQNASPQIGYLKYFTTAIGYFRKLVLNLRTCFVKLGYTS